MCPDPKGRESLQQWNSRPAQRSRYHKRRNRIQFQDCGKECWIQHQHGYGGCAAPDWEDELIWREWHAPFLPWQTHPWFITGHSWPRKYLQLEKQKGERRKEVWIMSVGFTVPFVVGWCENTLDSEMEVKQRNYIGEFPEEKIQTSPTVLKESFWLISMTRHFNMNRIWGKLQPGTGAEHLPVLGSNHTDWICSPSSPLAR